MQKNWRLINLVSKYLKKKSPLKKEGERKLKKNGKNLHNCAGGKNVGNKKRIFIFFYFFFFGKIENPAPFFLHIQGARGVELVKNHAYYL